MELEQIVVAVSRATGPVAYMAFLTVGRGNVLPIGARWIADGWWSREPTELAIMREIEACPETPGGAGVTGWRILADGEAPADRTYRDAIFDRAGKLEHDMPTARTIHRNRIRAQRSVAMADLDGQWMRAQGQGKKAEADGIEAERQKWRDAPADPRIDAAQTVEDLKLLHGA